MAAWWVVTRAMVMHSVVLGIALTIIAFTTETTSNSYAYILHWAPIQVWGVAIAVLAILWLLVRGWACIAAGLLIVIWFFIFATGFFISWITLDLSGTTATGWITYTFLAWAWMLVTYVVWRDERYVKAEMVKLIMIREEIDELKEHGTDPR